MPRRYPYLLFDADDTLFDYRRAEADAVRGAFDVQGLAFDEAWLAAYQVVNARIWLALEEGRVTAARLRVQRWEELFAELGLTLDPVEFSGRYLEQLRLQAHLVDGALEVVSAVREHHRLALITNGLSDVQRPRLARSPLAGAFEHVVISEEIGAAKPDPAIFEAALRWWGSPEPSAVLVIGDSLSSDVAGGAAAGLDTCWFNPRALSRGAGPVATYEIGRLEELLPIVAG